MKWNLIIKRKLFDGNKLTLNDMKSQIKKLDAWRFSLFMMRIASFSAKNWLENFAAWQEKNGICMTLTFFKFKFKVIKNRLTCFPHHNPKNSIAVVFKKWVCFCSCNIRFNARQIPQSKAIFFFHLSTLH